MSALPIPAPLQVVQVAPARHNITGPRGRVVGVVYAQTEADAIVRAVNSHAALVEALRGLLARDNAETRRKARNALIDAGVGQ